MFALAVACAVLVSGVYGACQDHLLKNQQFINCNQGFLAFMQTVDMTNPAYMCSEEGQAAFGCMFQYMKDCPAIAPTGMSEEQFKAMCRLIGSSGGMGGSSIGSTGNEAVTEYPCMEVRKCTMTAFQSDAPPSFPEEDATIPFLSVPFAIQMLCGPMKEAFECVDGMQDTCPAATRQVISTINHASMESAKSGYTSPNYNEYKTFLANRCPGIPADFATDSCLNNQLGSSTYKACVTAAKYDNSTTPPTCEQFEAVKMCAKEAVATKCNEEKYNTLVEATLFMLPNLRDCETSGSAIGTASYVLVFVTQLLVVYFNI